MRHGIVLGNERALEAGRVGLIKSLRMKGCA